MSMPIADTETLGLIVQEVISGYFNDRCYVWIDASGGVEETCQEAGEMVRRAVVPPDHIVVPRAKHNALMNALEVWRTSEGPSGINIGALYDAYHAKLGAQP